MTLPHPDPRTLPALSMMMQTRTILRFSLLALALGVASLPDRANADQPTYDFDFGALMYGPPIGDDQQTTVAVNSVAGNDANAGTLPSPKLTLPTSLASNGNLGLYRGSSFWASLPLAAAASTGGSMSVRGLSLTAGPLPIVSALDRVANNAFIDHHGGVFSVLWTPTDSTITADGYQNVYVIEINTATEAAYPIASRQRMVEVSSLAAVSPSRGTCYVQAPGTGPNQSGSSTQWKVTLQPSDGLTPGTGSYRYEVVSRYAPAHFGDGTYAGNATASGLELIGSSWGYGSIGGPNGFSGDRLAILHCSSHGAVLGGGSLSRSVFYEQSSLLQNDGTTGTNGAIQLAWYTHTSAANLSWEMDHCLFYTKGGINGVSNGDRVPYAVISHTSDGSTYQRGDITDCAFLGGRFANGALKGTAIDYVNVAAGTINRVYVQGIQNILGNSMPLAAEVKNSVFQDCQYPQVALNFHDNIVLAQSATDPTSTANYPRALLLYQNGASASNNILWSHGLSGYTVASSDQASGIDVQFGVTTATAQRNIIILDPANKTTTSTYLGLPSGAPTGFAIDYNLVVNLDPAGFATNGGTGDAESWGGYISQYPNLDQHSLYLDLSGDPRGIKALFVDPINGDFRWAQTDVAAQCAAYCLANNVGPATVTTHWPVVPAVDDAAAAISLLPPKITSAAAVTFTEGTSGRYQITTDQDGTPNAPGDYGIAGQPTWLNANAGSGLVSGIPPQTGSTAISVSATNRAGTGSASLGITVQTAYVAWQNAYFTATDLADPAISGPNATPAGDAIPNLLKYALNLPPKSAGTAGLPTVSIATVGLSKFLTLTYNQSLAAPDVTYTVEVSGDLQTWSSGSNNTLLVSTTTNAAGTAQTVVQRDLIPTSSARQRFIRLRVNQATNATNSGASLSRFRR